MTKKFSREYAAVCLVIIAGIVYLAAGPQPAFAKGKKNGGQTGAPTSQPMNPQLMAAEQQVQTAQLALNAASTAFKKKYEDTPQWNAAADAQKAAQKALAKEHEAVLEKLADSDDYKAAITKKEQASADLEAARADPTDADPQHTADLATAVIDATQEKSKLENDALANDPGYAQVKSKLDEADKAMFALQSQEKTAMQADPDWQQAHQNLVNAQEAYAKLVG